MTQVNASNLFTPQPNQAAGSNTKRDWELLFRASEGEKQKRPRERWNEEDEKRKGEKRRINGVMPRKREEVEREKIRKEKIDTERRRKEENKRSNIEKNE